MLNIRESRSLNAMKRGTGNRNSTHGNSPKTEARWESQTRNLSLNTGSGRQRNLNHFRLGSFVLLVLLCPLVTSIVSGQEEDLSILAKWVRWSDSSNLLQHHLNTLALRQVAGREEEIRSLRSAEEWRLRQAQVRHILHQVIGPFPDKSPLNAKVVGTVIKSRFRVEKIIFESLPEFYVTGCLFIPADLSGKTPAILNVIGHTGIAFRSPSYQRLILNLVLKGFIVFAIDPIGQGERLQYYDSDQGRSVVGGPTTEHSYFGKQCFVTGSSAARYFTWDGIRAIDYLVSRPEVDPNRIGVTGISGGGTQTSYIAALDDRVLASAPANYICGLRRLFESIGPQDAEQNINGGLAHGIDHADFLEVRAPKPTLVVATTRDFFSIQGARETVAEAKRAYRAFGAEENLTIVEDDYVHGYTQKNREAIYSFFQEHLNRPGDPSEMRVQPLGRDELRVTVTGQVSDSLGGETVYSINRVHSEKLIADLNRSRRTLSTHLNRVKKRAQEISGYLPPQSRSEVVYSGNYRRTGYSIERYAISGEDEAVLPFLFLKPNDVSKPPAIIYLHPDGKATVAEPGGEMENLVRRGFAVLAPDLSGSGELGSVNNAVTFLAMQIGRSVVGIRAAEIVRCVQYLESRADINQEQIFAIAKGEMCSALIHAAAFDPRIKRVALLEPLVSFRAFVMNRFYTVSPAEVIANALTAYDLPDLEASLAPRPLLVVTPRDQLSRPAGRLLRETDFKVVRDSYRLQGAEKMLGIHQLETFESPSTLIEQWLSVPR